MSDSKTTQDDRKADGGAERAGSDEGRSHGTNWLERTVAWISALLLLSAMAYLVAEGLGGTEPARFEARPERIWPSGESYQVLLSVRNTGGTSVQNLRLTVELKEGDTTVAQTKTGLSWLPAGSSREAVAILDEDPNAYELEVSFDGYELP